MTTSCVRTQFFATTAGQAEGPEHTLQLAVLYPARLTGSERERSFGIVDAEPANAPYPVLIHLHGVNCDPQRYQWLLLDVVRRGYVAVIVSWVAETMPGVTAQTPGIDLGFCRPELYGTGPTASAVAPILRVLEREQRGTGPLAGMLDLERIALGGHSGGGSVALHSADVRYFPAVRAVFGYGAHTCAATALGFAPGTVLSISSELPVLLLGGTEDGVIASSSGRYGTDQGDPRTPLLRTFHEALGGARGDRFLAILRGANHFSVVFPEDPTAGRAFLDRPERGDGEALRALISALVCAFLDAFVRGRAGALEAFLDVLDSPLVETSARK